jgi:hypothetical protein
VISASVDQKQGGATLRQRSGDGFADLALSPSTGQQNGAAKAGSRHGTEYV